MTENILKCNLYVLNLLEAYIYIYIYIYIIYKPIWNIIKLHLKQIPAGDVVYIGNNYHPTKIRGGQVHEAPLMFKLLHTYKLCD